MTTLTTAAMLGACSSDDVIVNEQQPVVDMLGDNVELIEPIRLGVSTGMVNASVTRHAIDPKDTVGNFDLDSIGIFMLAAYNQSSNASASLSTVNWNRASAANLQCTPIDNWYAKVAPGVDSIAQLLGGGKFTQVYLTKKYDHNVDSVFYYPVTSKYANRFYGYFPYQDNSKVTMSATQRIINFEDLDGKTEILWGQSDIGDPNVPRPLASAEDSATLWKYSARFFRINETYAKSFPTIEFKHKLMAFQFAIQGIKDPIYNYDHANKVVLDTVIVYDVPTHAQLIVADNANSANNGKLTFTWNDHLDSLGIVSQSRIVSGVDLDSTYIVDRAENDLALVKERVHNDSIIKVGQRLLLPVPVNSTSYYNIKVRLKYIIDPSDRSKDLTFESEMPISVDQVSTGSGFKEGTVYTVLLKIAGPQAVTVKATLDEWKDAESDDEIKPIDFW